LRVVDGRAGLTCSWCRSGSMEPAFYRGDLLFLTNPPHERYKTGDITVYKVPGAEIPIVHRVLETHDLPSSNNALCVFFLLPCSLGC
jgi:signal peptidase